MEPVTRLAVRVLLVNESSEVLLFRGFDPAHPDSPYWFTAGGGIDPGESPAEAAVRELREETGLHVTKAELGKPVHEEVTHFSFNGVPYRQEQEFYLVRVPDWTVDTTGFDEWELRTVDNHHWWKIGELERTREVYYPRDLVQVLKRLGVVAC